VSPGKTYAVRYWTRTLAGANGSAVIEDFELLADADALELIGEDDLEFYEWALAQSADAAAQSSG
jgi:hypothetical protein